MPARTVRRLAALGLTALAVGGCGGHSEKDVTDAQLALMPLPKSAYGPAVAPLTIDSSSGVSDNDDAARVDLDPTVTAATLAQLGRITGFALDFSSVRAFTSRTGGLVDAATGVDLFEDADGASRYAAKQLAEPRQLERRAANGVTFRNVSSFRIPLESGAAEAVSGEIRLGGLSFWMTFSVFRHDKLVAEVALTRADGFGDDRARIVPLTRAFDARIRGVLDGSVNGKPVPLPPSTRQELGGLGVPNGGPELADAVLTVGDFGTGRLVGEGYARDQSAVAVYLRRFEPARLGTARLARADLTVQLHPSAKDAYAALATRRAAVTGARGSTLLTSAFSAALGSTAPRTAARFDAPRTVRAGDTAFALRASFRPRGRAQTQLVIAVVNVGRLDQIVTLVGSPGARIPDTELTGLLRSAAGRMRAALAAKKGALTG